MSKPLVTIIAALLVAACTASGPDTESDAAAGRPTTTTTTAKADPVAEADDPTPRTRPTELAIASGWKPIAELAEDFDVRSIATTDTTVYLVGGPRPTEQDQQIPAAELLAVDRSSSTIRRIEWPGEARGDIANLGENVILSTGSGLFRLEAVTRNWAKVADGNWSVSWTTDREVDTSDGDAWSPESGASAVPPFPVASIAQVIGTPDALYLRLPKSGILMYDRRGGDWEALRPHSLYPTATSMVAGNRSIIAADYEMDAAEWDAATQQWETLPPLPLRFYECLPIGVDLRTTSGFRLCSGIALWDAGRWITIPLLPSDGQHFGGQNEIIAQLESQLLSYPIPLDGGRPTWGRTIPLGVFLLDVPIGWTIDSQEFEGETALGDKIIETRLTSGEGATCAMRSMYLGTMALRTERRENRRGQPQSVGQAGDLLVVSRVDSVDTTEIACPNIADADKLADHIWSQYVPASQLISGTLPNGRPYEILTATVVDDTPGGVSAGVIVEPDGPPAIGSLPMGITTIQRATDSGSPRTATPYVEVIGRTIGARSGDWVMRIRLYDETIAATGLDAETLARFIAPGDPISGLPTFDLSPPLYWSDDELPVQTEVSYQQFTVRWNSGDTCGAVALGCSSDRSIEVMADTDVHGPGTEWPGGTVRVDTE